MNYICIILYSTSMFIQSLLYKSYDVQLGSVTIKEAFYTDH